MKKLFIILLTLGTLMASPLPHYETQTLKNGLQVVVIPMHNDTGVISTDIFYKV